MAASIRSSAWRLFGEGDRRIDVVFLEFEVVVVYVR